MQDGIFWDVTSSQNREQEKSVMRANGAGSYHILTQSHIRTRSDKVNVGSLGA